jgi:hypothetical protein
MCDIPIEEIQDKGLDESNLPYNLCTHMLFRIALDNGIVPNNVIDGKEYTLLLSYFGFTPDSFTA